MKVVNKNALIKYMDVAMVINEIFLCIMAVLFFYGKIGANIFTNDLFLGVNMLIVLALEYASFTNELSLNMQEIKMAIMGIAIGMIVSTYKMENYILLVVFFLLSGIFNHNRRIGGRNIIYGFFFCILTIEAYEIFYRYIPYSVESMVKADLNFVWVDILMVLSGIMLCVTDLKENLMLKKDKMDEL